MIKWLCWLPVFLLVLMTIPVFLLLDLTSTKTSDRLREHFQRFTHWYENEIVPKS